MAGSRLVFISDLCTGCRSCELACSFHRLGLFRPDAAGLHVLLDRETGAVALAFDERCDLGDGGGCSLCVEACAPRALRVEG